MYDNILNRSLRFTGTISERAKNLIEQVDSFEKMEKNFDDVLVFFLSFSYYEKVPVNV